MFYYEAINNKGHPIKCFKETDAKNYFKIQTETVIIKSFLTLVVL